MEVLFCEDFVRVHLDGLIQVCCDDVTGQRVIPPASRIRMANYKLYDKAIKARSLGLPVKLPKPKYDFFKSCGVKIPVTTDRVACRTLRRLLDAVQWEETPKTKGGRKLPPGFYIPEDKIPEGWLFGNSVGGGIVQVGTDQGYLYSVPRAMGCSRFHPGDNSYASVVCCPHLAIPRHIGELLLQLHREACGRKEKQEARDAAAKARRLAKEKRELAQFFGIER